MGLKGWVQTGCRALATRRFHKSFQFNFPRMRKNDLPTSFFLTNTRVNLLVQVDTGFEDSFSAQQIVDGFYAVYVFDALGCGSVNGYDLSLSSDCVVFYEAFVNQQLQVSVDLGITQLSLVHDMRLYSAFSCCFQDFGNNVMPISTPSI